MDLRFMRMGRQLSTWSSAAALVLGASRLAHAVDATVLSYAPAEAPMPSVIAEGPAKEPIKQFEPPRGRVCFNAAETRDKIASRRLTEPFRALLLGRLQGEALRAKLCRWNDDIFVYEVAVLRRDGHVVHVYVNALNGQNVGPTADVDRR